jgi:hypothetical protein
MLLELVLEFIYFPCHTCYKRWKGEPEWFTVNQFLFCSKECYCAI